MPLLSKEFIEIQATIECRFTLKRVRDMIVTCNQMNCILSLTFLSEKPIYNLKYKEIINISKLSNVYVLFLTAVVNYLRNRLSRHCHWMGFFWKHKYNIYMFNVLIRNNEQFDQNLHHITFFNTFFWRNRSKSKIKVI